MKKFSNILIIDDDRINNFLFSKIIQVTSVAEKVETVISGREGLNILEDNISKGNELPEVIFLDINMPVMNGWEFLDKYQGLPLSARQRVNLYILSSSVYPEDIDKAKSYDDVVDYIVKPLTKEILLQIHNKHLTSI